jgi:hypothetical protein
MLYSMKDQIIFISELHSKMPYDNNHIRDELGLGNTELLRWRNDYAAIIPKLIAVHPRYNESRGLKNKCHY